MQMREKLKQRGSSRLRERAELRARRSAVGADDDGALVDDGAQWDERFEMSPRDTSKEGSFLHELLQPTRAYARRAARRLGLDRVPELLAVFGWALAGTQRYPWSCLAALLLGYLVFLAPLFDPWTSPFDQPALAALAFLLGGLAMGLVLAMATVALEPLILRCSGARWPSVQESGKLLPLVEQTAAKMGLPTFPPILVCDRRDPAAQAGLRYLVVTRGLLEALDDEQFAGVLAHALAHWSEPDAMGRRLVVLFSLPLTLAYGLTDWCMRFLRQLLDRERQLVLFVAVVGCLLAPLWLYARLWVWLLSTVLRWESEERELDADLVAARTGVGPGLLRALELQQHWTPEPPRGLEVLLAEPPPRLVRIEALARALRRARYATSQT